MELQALETLVGLRGSFCPWWTLPVAAQLLRTSVSQPRISQSLIYKDLGLSGAGIAFVVSLLYKHAQHCAKILAGSLTSTC